MADGLMTEANAENGTVPGKGLDHFERHPGFGRGARTGRNQNALGVEGAGFGRSDLVVAKDTLLHAQLTEVLDEVEGKRIVVVDDEQHSTLFILTFRGGSSGLIEGQCPNLRFRNGHTKPRSSRKD